MPTTRKTPEQIKAEVEECRRATKAAIAELKQNQKARVTELRAKQRRAHQLNAQRQKKKDDHAKILIGVAMIHRAQKDSTAQKRLREILQEFYASEAARLEAALYGMTITVVTESGAGFQEAPPTAHAA